MAGSPFAPSERIPVAVLGATGSVGQRFVALLEQHPWFELRRLVASDRSSGKHYREAVRWVQATPLPLAVSDMLVEDARPRGEIPLVFSALDAEVAGPIEEQFARAGALVVSNARNHRMDPAVPLVVPEVNPQHLELARGDRFGPGAILTNGNCSSIGLALALKPLDLAFGVKRVHVVTMQAISGAGLPGPSSFQMLDNLMPFIPGEEGKIETETKKILGRLVAGRVQAHELEISASCNRVAVIDGHTLCVSVELVRAASAADIRAAWAGFRSAPQELALPSAPMHPTLYLEDESAPQPRLHRDLERGMAAVVGRLRPCPVLGWKFVTLSHNTLRGAAGGALLLAELAVAHGFLSRERRCGAHTRVR